MQLESLAKELKKKQRGLTENSSGNAFQRARFMDVKKLLGAKLALHQAGAWGAGGGGGGGAGAGAGERDGKRQEETREYSSGGSNVMELPR